MELNKEILIKVTKEDWDKSEKFGSVDNCLIATAVRRNIRKNDISEGVNHTVIGVEDGFDTFIHREFGVPEYDYRRKNKLWEFEILLTKATKNSKFELGEDGFKRCNEYLQALMDGKTITAEGGII